ncbi:MAG: acyltransferase family protein [Gaiellaceae bacterium]
MKRRPDIQGLRAVAILLVVLYHADLSFRGGFTGVDVFFVISGFVIAGTLLGELTSTGRMSLGGFYARRVRRILPAPAVMLVFVALAGILADPAGTQRMSAMTGIAASALGANFYLEVLPNGYFNVSTQLNPLLHTWMLSVIAQIYIVFPLLLLAAWWLGRSRLGRGRSKELAWTIVALVSALSFLLSFGLTHGYVLSRPGGYEKFAFYATPTRFWEFGVGALLMLALRLFERLPGRLALAFDLAGAAAVGVSAFYIQQVGFRETSALLPVAGACLLIAAGTRTPLGFTRLLSLRPVVWLGDISYSLYLWHWPFIVFAKALWPSHGAWLAGVAAAVSLLPAWLTYRYVENPIRFRARTGSRAPTSRRAGLALASACIAVPIVANLGLMQAQKLIDRTASLKSWRHTTALHTDVRRGCSSSTPLGPDYRPKCTWHVAHPRGRIVLFGDSNAGMYAEPVVKAGNSAGYDVTVVTASSCPYLGLRITRIDGEEHRCPSFGSKSIDYMVKTKPSLVVLVTRTDFYLQNPDDGLAVVGDGGFTFTSAGKARLWRRALHSTLMRLNAAGVPVLLVHPIPVLPLDQQTCAIVRILLGACSSSLPRSSVDNWLRLAVETENAGAAGVKLTKVLDFENQLCGKNRCTTVKNGVSLYRDSRHLSVDGALTLTGTFERAIVAHAIPRK